MFRPARSLAFLVVLVISGLLGRATIIEEANLALVWPAGGVAALWLMWSTWRQRIPDLALLGIAILVLNVATGAPLDRSLVFVVVNCGQAALFVYLLERFAPDLDGAGGALPVSSPDKLMRFLAAAVIACAGAVAVGSAGFAVADGIPTLSLTVLWWGRQVAGLLLVTLTAQLLWQAYRDGSLLARREDRPTWISPLELLLLLSGTVALYLIVFVQSSLPLAFMPALASVWAGLRLTPAWTAVHGAAGSVAVILFTVAGTGPFALAPGPVEQAYMTQLLIAVLLFTGLSLSVAVHVSEESLEALRREQQLTRRQAAAAQAQADLLQTINQTLDDALLVVGDDGSLITANPAAVRLFAQSSLQGVPGHLDRELSWEEFRRLAVEGALDEPSDLIVIAGDRERRVLACVARPLPDGGAVIVLSDVTLERQRTDELASFAGVVAHDLRNPVGVVRGWADELRAQILDGAAAQDLLPIGRSIESAAQRMEELISDLLSHATSRDRSLQVERIDIAELVEEIAAARGVPGQVLTTRFDSVAGDRSMLRQLLDNLIGNAVKYVAPGVIPRIEVTGARTGDMMTISLVDNGIGVPEDQRSTIFQQFQRAHRNGYQGTGLGLAICRTIVERHGGEIAAEPGPDDIGSRFWFTVPIASDDTPAHQRPPAALRRVEVA